MVGLRGAASLRPALWFGGHLYISYVFCTRHPQNEPTPHLSAVRSLSFFPRFPFFLPFFPLPCLEKMKMSNVFIKKKKSKQMTPAGIFLPSFELLLHLWQKVSCMYLWCRAPWAVCPVAPTFTCCQSVCLYSPTNSTYCSLTWLCCMEVNSFYS